VEPFATQTQSQNKLLPVLSKRIRALIVFIGGPATFMSLWIGLFDFLAPPTLSGRIVAILYVLLGLVIVIAGRRVFGRDLVKTRTSALLVAASCGYIYGSIAVYAWFGRPWLGQASAGFLCLSVLAFLLLFRDALMSHISKAIQLSALITLITTLGTVWYESIYLPDNVQVGIETTVSLGHSSAAPGGETLVPIRISMENKSGATAVVLTSMITVTGVNYSGPGNAVLPPSAELGQVLAVGKGLAKDPNLRFGGTPSFTELAVARLVDDGSYLFPGDDQFQRNLVVVIPRGSDYSELNIQTRLDYARTARLQLGRTLGTDVRTEGRCRNDFVTRWGLRQSELQIIAHGTQVLWTNWCADTNGQYIWSNVLELNSHTSSSLLSRNNAAYGIVEGSRFEMLPFH
jgi:hypothetical protein